MDPITLAMTLAQFAPGIIKLLTGSDKAGEVAEKVVGIAETVTGKQGSAAVNAVAADPATMLEFRKAIFAQQTSLELAYLADVQSARTRDVELAKVGQFNYVRFFLSGFTALGICVLVYYVIKDDSINEYAKGIITLSLGRLWGYMDGIYNYEFGTTRSSSQKDATIQKLSNT